VKRPMLFEYERNDSEG